jgi:membrane protein DedA with SNARE-associated domain
VVATILNFAQSAGYPLLFGLILAESGGVPVPGETALITAAALAGQGKLSIGLVIPIAVCAAILGDNLGYLVGRRFGRGLLERPGVLVAHRHRVLALADPFFARHGPKTVFFGRWILGLRTWAAWLAGASRMHWRSFAVWNAAGAVSWASTVGLVAYLLGQSTAGVFTVFGLVAFVAALAAGGVIIARRAAADASP